MISRATNGGGAGAPTGTILRWRCMSFASEVQAFHAELQGAGGHGARAILARERGTERLAGSAGPKALQMAAEVIRSDLTGLAIWWNDHPHVPRERIVETAVTVLWTGFERARR